MSTAAEALAAVLTGDGQRLDESLARMSVSELTALAGAAQDLSAAAEMASRRES